MNDIQPTIFKITKEEVEEIFEEMIDENLVDTKLKLNREQIIHVLEFIECDEFLAKDIRRSISGSIMEVLDMES